jgi:uncharacterized cofD-like protein
MLRALFTYRFRSLQGERGGDEAGGLDGHNLGNLFISALTDITGSVEGAYAWAGRLLGAQGQVIPVTTSNVHLCARLVDGYVLRSEAAIDVRTEHLDAEIDYVYLDHPAYPTPSALTALSTADLVVIGPGDLYTSIVPNLLVDGIADAVARARHRLFVVNLMTKPGESDGYSASTFVERLLDYLAPASIDAVLVNTASAPLRVLKRYAAEGAHPVKADVEAIEAMGIEVLVGPLASSRHFMRHDPNALADMIMAWVDAHAEASSVAPPRTITSSRPIHSVVCSQLDMAGPLLAAGCVALDPIVKTWG